MIEQTPRLRRGLMAFQFLGLACAAALGASDLAAQQRDDGPVREFSSSRGPISKGFLFIDGRYIPPPYVIEQADDSIRVNGELLSEEEFDLSDNRSRFESRGRQRYVRMMQMRRGGPRFGPMRDWNDSPSYSLSFVENELNLGEVVVLFRQQRPLILGSTREGLELLRTLCAASIESVDTATAPDSLQDEASRQSWRQLVSEFAPTPEFLQRAGATIEVREAVFAKNDAGVEANLWGDRISFPLTIFAIVIVVLAFGHLLSNAPLKGDQLTDPEAIAHARLTLVQSLVFVGLLSVVDLVWTLMAYQAGSMRELNPLGSGLIEDASQLVIFKTSVTAAAIGLLYWLHQAPLAQRASWWCCLILTLLTARWLTFQSMFL